MPNVLPLLPQSKLVRAWLKEYGLPQFARDQNMGASPSVHLAHKGGPVQSSGIRSGNADTKGGGVPPAEHGSDQAPDTIRGSVGAAASSQVGLKQHSPSTVLSRGSSAQGAS